MDDIVEGIINLMPKRPMVQEGKKLATNESQAPYAVFNIGNSKPVKLLDFIECIEGALGKKAEKNLMEIQPGDVTTTFADMTNLQDLTGYSPNTSIADGTKKFVDWYLEYYHKS